MFKIKTNIKNIFFSLLGSIIYLFYPESYIKAGTFDDVKNNFATSAKKFFGDPTKDPSGNAALSSYGNIIAVVTSFIGIIFLTNLIIAGLQWMHSGGEKEKIKTAQTKIIHNIIGIIIIVAAYIISKFILTNLISFTNPS